MSETCLSHTKPWSRMQSLSESRGGSKVTKPIFSNSIKRYFRRNICSEDYLRSRIFGTFVVKFLACELRGRLRLYMKVKNDHRSKFSNLSNWKEEAWKKNQGFNGIRTRELRVTGHGFESRWNPDFFQASSFQLLKLENLLDDHSSLS